MSRPEIMVISTSPRLKVEGGKRLTLSLKKGPNATCRGTIDANAIVITVAGCPAFSAHVSLPSVRFARRKLR